jgi:hypothetical protein
MLGAAVTGNFTTLDVAGVAAVAAVAGVGCVAGVAGVVGVADAEQPLNAAARASADSPLGRATRSMPKRRFVGFTGGPL